MSNKTAKPKNLKFPVIEMEQGSNLELPGILRTNARSGSNDVEPLLAGVAVEKVYRIGSISRSGSTEIPEKIETTEKSLLAIEAEDGTTIFIRSDKLAEDIERIRPEAIIDGEVDFAKFRDPNAASRGIGDVLWKAVTLLRLPTDGLVNEAQALAEKWAEDLSGSIVKNQAYDTGSFLGAKALMWKIESQLAGNSGLYEWKDRNIVSSDLCQKDDERLEKVAKGEPTLILIHGTASYTQGGFDGLRQDEETWKILKQQFSGGIFGYEHRTFSQSPIENALELAEALPKNARLCVLTHSRGGLVGDLLCLGRSINTSVIDRYQINTRDSDDEKGLKREEQEERQRLRTLLKTLKDKNIVVQRYVRVACPARGTRILSDNLDAALSDFTNLIQVSGGALVGVIAGTIGGPVAAKAFGKGASSALGVLKRLILEIAGRRIDPLMIPGIAAMRVDSPLASFLAHPEIRRHDTTRMAVIAGDTEFDSLGLSNFRRRIANLFCDWRLFDQHNNDLVVDTDSMYAGLGFEAGAHYLFDQAASATHFRYFGNSITRDALCSWLVEDDLSRVTQFLPLTNTPKIPWHERDARQQQRGIVAGSRPIAILIPGIMGSHIEINRKNNKPGSGNRIWFDLVSLAIGDLDRIEDPKSENVFTEDIFERFYGDLFDFLQNTHVVYRSPYDWRKSLDHCAKELLGKIDEATGKHPDQPIRLLAHSMGGLVVRTLIKKYPQTWNKVIESGGRLVMLGTPNNGSHMMVHTLLGKTDSVRMLAKVDLKWGHDLQHILNVVRRFPGALALLPRPGFLDAGSEPRIATGEYYKKSQWDAFKKINMDRWYSDGVVGVPSKLDIKHTEDFWRETLTDNNIINPERVSYVFGQGDKTPCGVVLSTDNQRLKLLYTSDGDGTVTWESGQLENLDNDHCWYMPVEHGDLTGEEEYFPAIVELLEKGSTGKLGRLPRARGISAETFVLEPPPPVVPNEEELMRALMGSGPRNRKITRPRKILKISVCVGDLSYCTSPVLCGHYYGDVISGAEAALDSKVEGRLSQRQRMGVYADRVGTSAIVLMPSTLEDRQRKTQRGAVIIGLGEMNGRLSSTDISESVRVGVLRLLLRALETPAEHALGKIKITSLLIGQNSTAHISIGESAAAVIRGICEANAKFPSDRALITEVEFIDLYRDVAITAAHAIQDLPKLMTSDLVRLGTQLDIAHELQIREGARHRLWANRGGSYWPRLIVTDADRNEELCPAECYQAQKTLSVPEDFLRELVDSHFDSKDGLPAKTSPTSSKIASLHDYPDRLRYVFVSERARSESTALQRQPGLIESIVNKQITKNQYNSQLSRTLFELMVPLDFKPTAREVDRLVLQVDGYTANLPWELLQADNTEPLAIKTAIIRQLSTPQFRRNVRTAPSKTACIIVDPSTEDYAEYFGRPKGEKLPKLDKAESEGEIVREKLKEAGYLNDDISYSPSQADALSVLHKLLSRPYRILVIAGHGVFEERHEDGKLRTGVVLSGGSLITAAEIGQMEVVPELVFLNCCHLGAVSKGTAFNRLAYSISRELIEMGVRCIVAAGWAVDDQAACTFAEKFFHEVLVKKISFGHAVHEARKETYNKHRGSNTWGAYQAYGDPGYRLDPNDDARTRASYKFTAVDELLHELSSLLLSGKRPGFSKPNSKSLHKKLSGLRERVPSEWLERPEVLEALGKVYADIASDGFEIARDYYRQAIACEDKTGVVAIKTIEQLANMEARAGEKRNDKEGETLIITAINRLEALRTVSTSTGLNTPLNPERAALLGSAHKRHASYLVNKGKNWKIVSNVLKNCENAYYEAMAPDPVAKPYHTLNYLQFGLLVDGKNKGQDIELARCCADTARRNFEKNGDFWDAVMPADAEVTIWLLSSSVAKTDFNRLKKCYTECISGVPAANRYMDSVITNLSLLAKFLCLRDGSHDAARVEVLTALANDLGS